ncbi:MAG: RluA family pseudouridine synthase [Sphaerochaetaceae bacterium]
MSIRERRLNLVVDSLESPVRLDAYVGSHTTDISRSTLSEEGTVILLNGKVRKKSKLVKEGDMITILYKETFFEGIVGEDIPLKVLYEDEDLLVIDKEQGMVVHPANGNMEHTLVNALVHRYGRSFCEELQEGQVDEEEVALSSPAVRPGIVHRLDKDTSGVMVVARNRLSHRNLAKQFKERTTSKVYIALVKGTPTKKHALIEKHLKRDPKDRKKFTTCSDSEGRSAKTEYFVLRQYANVALLRIILHTGRTHQIRVHLSKEGYPIIGDPVYGKEEGQSLMLHALQLELNSPSTGRRIRCTAAMPERFLTYLHAIRLPSNSAVRSQWSPTARDHG